MSSMISLLQADTVMSREANDTSHDSGPSIGSYHADGASPVESIPTLQKRATPPTQNGLNPRSCVTCRRRKVKCDKKHPCSNCSKAAIECIFPGPGRAPRRPRKPQDAELLERLKRLEGAVKGLGVEADSGNHFHGDPALDPNIPSPAKMDNDSESSSPPGVGMTGQCALKTKRKDEEDTNGMVKEFGRLQVAQGRSRYVSNNFWTSLSEEVAEMQDILDDPTDEEDDYPSPNSGSAEVADHQGFIFSFSSTILSLRRFHPPSEHIPLYWNIYKENVDPVLKVLHVPTMETVILQASKGLDHVGKPLEALMFAVYFAAVTSLSCNDCFTLLGVEREAALQNYRFAVEQAFARANFLSTQEIIILQALVIFLTGVRRTDDTRYVWTLVGLVSRLAQALGIHRDGEKFNVSPFETEMRRRLWWHIFTLDVRSSEDHGCDPTINEFSFDTKFPSNINDVDIYPSMKIPPKELEGTTEVTFDLIRFAVSTTVRRLSYSPIGPRHCQTVDASMGLWEREKMIEELHQHLESKYLCHCDTKKVPLHWVAATVARLIMAKMWLVVHHPFSRSDRGAGLPQETKDRLFHTSIEVIQFSHLLETEKTTQKWGWLFRTHVQWHALAFVISQLCIRTEGQEVDRAWSAIDGVLDDWGGALNNNQKGMMWKPLRKLVGKARMERAKALHQRAIYPLDGSLGPVPASKAPADSSVNMPAVETTTSYINSKYTSLDGFDGWEQVTDKLPQSDSALLFQLANEEHGENGAMNTDLAQGHVDPAILASEPPMMLEDNVNWAGWEDMVKDFDMGSAAIDGNYPNSNIGLGGQGLTNWF